MLLLSFLLLSIFTLGLTELSYDDTTCSVTKNFNDYTLSPNTVTYFRSPNFPTTMNNQTSEQQNPLLCKARFNTDAQNFKLWFVIFNGNVRAFSVWNQYQENYTISGFDADNYFIFAPSKNPIMFEFLPVTNNFYYTAFEGVVYTYTPANICPFSQQITNLQSNRVIPIASSYDLNSVESNSNCNWTFSINPVQLLKIVFKSFGKSTILYLETDGYIAEKFNMTVTQYKPSVYYYGSESGTFNLYYTATLRHSKFFALVSVVDKNPNKPKPVCQNTASGISTIVEHLNYESGYNAFDSCTYQFLIPQNYESLIQVYILETEKGADKLTFSFGSDTFVADRTNDYYYLTSNANGTMVDFSADGNTQQLGFKLVQTLINCQCAPSNIVIPCNNTQRITSESSGTGYYCSNMSCDFTISLDQACKNASISFKYSIVLRPNKDNLIVLMNNNLYVNFTSSLSERTVVFPPSQNISLQFSSGTVSASLYNGDFDYYWKIDASSIYPYFYPTVYLTEDLPYYLLQMNLAFNEGFIICTPPKDTLEMFVSETSDISQLKDYTLYDSDSTKNYIGDLNSPLISTPDYLYPRHISSSSGCFTIFKNRDTTTTSNFYVLFRMKNAHSKNCESTMNVFSVSYNTHLVGTAGEGGPCEITLLSASGLYPVSQFTDFKPSSTDNFQVLSTINRKIYFTTNSTDSWEGTTIYNPALNIKIPAEQNISLTVYSKHGIDLTESGNRGIFASPEFGGYKTGTMLDPMLLYVLQGYGTKYNVELIVKNMDGNGTVLFYNIDKNANFTLQANQTLSQNGTYFELIYQNFANFNFFIEYTVKSLIGTSTTTSTTITTTTKTTTSTTSTSTTSTTPTPTTSSSTTTTISPTTTIRKTTTSIFYSSNSSISTILSLTTLLISFIITFVKNICEL